MTTAPEVLSFPGVDRAEADKLIESLEAAAEGARVFVTALTGLDASVEFTLDPTAQIHWMRRRDDSLSVHLPVDVVSPPDLVPPPSPAAYRRAFRSNLLHRIGRLLASPTPDHPDPIGDVLNDPRPVTLPMEVRDLLRRPNGPRLLHGLFEHLEGHRADGEIRRALPHAGEYLAPRDEAVRQAQVSPDPVEALLARYDTVLRGISEPDPETLGHGLSAELSNVTQSAGPDGAKRLARVLILFIAPALLHAAHDLPEGAGLPVERMTGLTRIQGLTGRREIETGRVHEPVEGEVVRLPHTDGGEVLVRVHRTLATDVPPTPRTRHVLDLLADPYGPRAREAFAEEAAALRRALRVNWNRRYRGRHRSGKRVGIPNLRRYITLEDPRVFQRFEAPRGMSYYFHLLVDASYSMLEQDNASKAIAVAAGFTEVLASARIPVDVTLYSTALTVLHDHRQQIFEEAFGGDFGYLMAGTMEVEAVGWAKARSDGVEADHKLIVVLTDGTPVSSTLPHLGAGSLSSYYQDTLDPWLKRSGIEMLGAGIGLCPDYHPNAVCLEGGWESLAVFTELLEKVINEGDQQVRELWA